MTADYGQSVGEAEPFGTWQLIQVDRDCWIGNPAKAARADRSFLRAGDPDEVRKH